MSQAKHILLKHSKNQWFIWIYLILITAVKENLWRKIKKLWWWWWWEWPGGHWKSWSPAAELLNNSQEDISRSAETDWSQRWVKKIFDTSETDNPHPFPPLSNTKHHGTTRITKSAQLACYDQLFIDQETVKVMMNQTKYNKYNKPAKKPLKLPYCLNPNWTGITIWHNYVSKTKKFGKPICQNVKCTYFSFFIQPQLIRLKYNLSSTAALEIGSL